MRSVHDTITEALRVHEINVVYGPEVDDRCAYTPDGYVCDWEGASEQHPAHVASAVLAALESRGFVVRKQVEP